MTRLAIAGAVIVVAFQTLTHQSAAGQTAAPAREGDVERGKQLYAKFGCAGCHGLEGQGAPTSGPRIGPNPLPAEAFIKYVRAPRNQMPPYTARVVSDEELGDIRAFLAGRPKPASATLLAP
jgi:ubiquinol-cytochrome c reductase cytochrome c subunit